MTQTTFQTQSHIQVDCHQNFVPASTAMETVYDKLDTHQGAAFVSNYEYPDRYSRWDLGMVNPALELTSKQRHFQIRALNPNGQCLLSLIGPAIENHPHLQSFEQAENQIEGIIKPMPDFFIEEERSRQPSIFSIIRSISELFQSDDAYLGFYGAFGYDLVYQFENLQQHHPRNPEQNDCHLYFPTELVVVDRQKQEAFELSYRIHTPKGITSPESNTGASFTMPSLPPTGIIQSDHEEGAFEAKVQTIRERCQRGDHFEVVLSQKFSTPTDAQPTQLFQQLCELNPSPYSFLIQFGTEALVGASPEMYVRVTQGRFETCPISGTVSVGKDPMETAENIKQLLSSEKEESELAMCTDVDRNDMSRICTPGSVRLLGRRLIEKYSRLIHTVDHVEGTLAEEYDALDAILCHMWACTVTGSPKPVAMQTIEDMELSPRDWYSGCVGMIYFNGNVNTGMTLRTIHMKEGMASVRAGATLLYESDPKLEEQETRIKASAFLDAVLEAKNKKHIQPHSALPQSHGKHVLFVDHRDSFVHTLANYVRQTGAKVTTVRAGFPLNMLDELKPDMVFLSPGPFTPSDQKVPELVEELVKRQIPMFGVCLGLQGIVEHFGGSLNTFEHPWHGKASEVHYAEHPLFEGLPQPFIAGRYHSLHANPETFPGCLNIIAQTEDGTIMGVAHQELPIWAVQFHPESIMSLQNQAGIRLIHQAIHGLCA